MSYGVEHWATLCFFAAILHTFAVKRFSHLARYFKEGSVSENLLHLMGEVEVVFGIWAGIFLAGVSFRVGPGAAVQMIESASFVEPALVFVIMVICSTKPVLDWVKWVLERISLLIPVSPSMRYFFSVMAVGPLLGSLITEPAAMTVIALLLRDQWFAQTNSKKFKYAALGLLFVNISIGGTLTPYAAPPVLMVTQAWAWGLSQVFWILGVKAVFACFISTGIFCYRFRETLSEIHEKSKHASETQRCPFWVSAVSLVFLFAVVLMHSSLPVFFGIFLFFLGWVSVTKEYQSELRLKEGMLVGFFLAGLVILGGFQRWWLEPLFSQPWITAWSSLPMYLGAMGLTAITDNAALTYLAAQVSELSEVSRVAVVSGAVVGGGLTVIANAPNPAGYGILNSSFGKEGIAPLRLLMSALPFTLIAALIFWFFPAP